MVRLDLDTHIQADSLKFLNILDHTVSDFSWLFGGQKKKFSGPADFHQDGNAEVITRPLDEGLV